MSKYPNLSEADSIIMEILWRDGRCTSSEILKEIEEKLTWSRQTVRTYLARLIDKGLIQTEEINKRALLYFPAVSRESYAADRAENVLSRYYDSVPKMLAGILEKEKISEEELDELEKLIHKHRHQ